MADKFVNISKRPLSIFGRTYKPGESVDVPSNLKDSQQIQRLVRSNMLQAPKIGAPTAAPAPSTASAPVVAASPVVVPTEVPVVKPEEPAPVVETKEPEAAVAVVEPSEPAHDEKKDDKKGKKSGKK